MRLDRILSLVACIGLLAGAAFLATQDFDAHAKGGGGLQCGAPWHDGLKKIDTQFEYTVVDDPGQSFTAQICVDGARRRLAGSGLLALSGAAFGVLGGRRKTGPPASVSLGS